MEVWNKSYLVRYYLFFLVLSVGVLYFSHIQGGLLYQGDDIFFHHNRINGLALGIANGDFFPKINFYFLNGMGYAAPIFYGDLFLYPAAILRYAGLTIAQSYIGLLIMINFASYVIAYHSFKSYKENKQQALFFAFLYGTASYRLGDMIERAALGEVLALTFLPVALLGLWHIFRGNEKKFYLLGIGMSGVILTHMLTAVIFCFFIIFFICLNMDVIFEQKERVFAFVYAIGATILLVAGFLMPIIEQLWGQTYNFQVSPVITLEQSASSIQEYFWIAFKNYGHNNLGLFVIAGMFILVICYKSLSKLTMQLVIIGVVFFVLATNIAPQRLLSKTILNTVQFPWRFFLIVTLCICWGFADTSEQFFRNRQINGWFIRAVMLGVLLMGIGHSLVLPDAIKKWRQDSYTDYDPNYLGWGLEYIPSGMDILSLRTQPKEIRRTDMVTIDKTEWSYGKVRLNYQVSQTGKITLPFIYYKGYQARNIETDERLEVASSDRFPGLCEIIVGKNGKVEIFYEKTWIQRISMMVSVISWIILMTGIIRQKLFSPDKS
ncbi:hypothetical protein A5880_001380 [Enterococcus sp. 4G2_DIV0659]|uniref:Membrane protein 6-pyruvoyl-tetrahydropterin synthase-related domain-containing protein n=1 Tax=Candidatus Enterococcus mansonii TaxID=1834181 RepID=A0ABU8IEN9_9ENTE